MGPHSVVMSVVVKRTDNATRLKGESFMPSDDWQALDANERDPDGLVGAHHQAAHPSDDSFGYVDVPHDASSPAIARDGPIEAEHTLLFEEGHATDVTAGFEAESDVEESYWALSRAPLESLVFTLPLVAVYEIGVLLLGRGTPRNGADVWLRSILDSLGFGAYFFLLPMLTIIGLAAWHHLEHDRWRFSGRVLVGMVFESLALACVLVGIAHLQEGLWADVMPSRFALITLDTGLSPVFAEPSLLLQRLVGLCGAGLYEEVLFRLLLLPVLGWMLQRVGFSSASAAGGGVLLSALLFSAAHYVGLHGEAFDLYSFTFRTVAGVFFGVLFLLRGFGITAGTHAAYDVLVGLL